MNTNITKRLSGIYQISLRRLCTKRRYPIDPAHANQLPVFDYPVSNSTYNRLFVWGATSTGALGIKYKTQELQHAPFIRYPKRSIVGEHHAVTSIACGFGFTVFGVLSPTNKLFGTGINTDSQLGYHEVNKDKPLGVLFFPQPIHLPLKNLNSQIRKLSAGRAHLMVLTDEGIFLLGNNAYGQCGREIVADENYSGSRFIHHIERIDDKPVIDIECGQDHSLAITEDGSVYSCGWGADGQTGLGHFNSQAHFTKVKGDIASENIVKVASRADFVLAVNDKGEVFGWGNTEYSQLTLGDDCQQVCNPTYIKMCGSLGNIKDIAAGGTFCVVLNEEGYVFAWGYGLLGTGPKVQYSKVPIQIPPTLFGLNDFQPHIQVTSITCGVSHIGAVTNLGDLYAWGRNKSCCLGLGDEKDHYFPLRVCLGGLAKQVAFGVDHSAALCSPFV